MAKRKNGSQEDLKTSVFQPIAAELRESALSCSAWAEKFRVLKSGPWRFDNYEYLRQIHDEPFPKIVFMKSAQMGVTESATNRVLWHLDTQDTDVIYMFPTTGDVSNFSAGRFNIALDKSEKVSDLFAQVDNVTHKVTKGGTNLYLRGSKSRAQAKSVPAGFLVLDEFDEMAIRQVTLVRERLSGHMEKCEWNISTPTLPGRGITVEFSKSKRHYYYLKCPYCRKVQVLTFEKHISYQPNKPESAEIHCDRCFKVWHRDQTLEMISQGKWRSKDKGHFARYGYHINQLYSPTITPAEIVESLLDAKGDEGKLEEHVNSKLGLPYENEGAKISDAAIQKCIGDYRMVSEAPFSWMGVDVGNLLYITISTWDEESNHRILKLLTLTELDDLMMLIRAYNVCGVVIDMYPDQRAVKAFQQQFQSSPEYPHFVFMARYPRIEDALRVDEARGIVSLNRTQTLDYVFARFRNRTISIPYDAPVEFAEHIKAPVRIHRRNSLEQLEAIYAEGNDDDHYVHSTAYCEAAHALFPQPSSLAVGSGIIVPAEEEGVFYI